MFGGHGHNHGGKECAHGHGKGAHGHGKPNIGFGDEDEEKMMVKRQMMMQQMMMQQMMKANENKGEAGNEGDNSKLAMPINPMAMPQMTPQMMEISKKMFEQRQQLMKEYMDKGGESNPEAMQEMMAKAAQLQKSTMLQMKAAQQTSSSGNTNDPSNLKFDSNNLLNANLNNSKLDDLINKKSGNKKAKNEQEQKILDAISRKDYSELNAVKATQYGILERLKELIESNQTDPHKPDAENVYLLHWAAINNRIDIAKYLISINCEVDPIGGELESSPLNWAARSGHIQMVVYLLQNGANPNNFDIEGFSTIHLSTMFGHSIVTAYLLAKGLDPDMKDKNGVTPLMFAAQRIHSRDPAQLLLTFNARMNVQDNKGNTPLHYCVAFNNATVMKILLDNGASLDVKNHKGMNPIQFALDRGKGSAASMMRLATNDDKDLLPSVVRPIGKNKEMRKLGTRIYPFFMFFYFGMLFEASISIYLKLALFIAVYGISFVWKSVFFDKDVLKYIPFATTLAIIFWLYVTYIIHLSAYVFRFDLFTMFFSFSTAMSWYNLYKAYKCDPGILSNNRDQMNKTIIKFVEQDEFTLEQFCTMCIVRKPLRSKHCAQCDKCVAKFDHHCPWVDNCIGQNNLKYFIGFVFWTPICLCFYLQGAFVYYQNKCYMNDATMYPNMTSFRLFLQFFNCSPWIGFFTIVAVLNTFWISCLCLCHIYQSIFVALTTNERLNVDRYKHFFDENGKYRNPFNFGILQNFVDLIEMNVGFMKPTMINWRKEYNIQDIINSKYYKKREKANYQIV